MPLALFHIHVKSDEQPHETAYRYENHKRDCANRPFNYGSCFHSLATDEHGSNTDYKAAVTQPLESVCVRHLWKQDTLREKVTT
jgi:hypothetical protein